MSVRKRFYQGAQLRIRGWRMSIASLEDNSRFDPALHSQLQLARKALENAEETAAFRLMESEKVA